MGSQDEPRRSQFQPLNLPPAGGRPSGSRDEGEAPARGGDRQRPTPPPPAGPARFGSPGNQFRPLPKYGGDPNSSNQSRPTPSRPTRDGRRDQLDARHAPPDDSFPGYDASASYAAPDRRGASQSRSGGWAEEPSRSRGRSQRDPWDRDWAAWSETSYTEAFEDEFERSDGEWERWNRSAWGMGPNEGTMASVAMVVQPARYSQRGKPNGKGGAWAELGQWAKAGFARRAAPSKKAVRLLVVVSILGTILLSGLGTALAAYADYASVKGLADNGKTAFLHVGEDLGLGSKTLKGQKVDVAHQNMAIGDLNLALSDFQQLHDKLVHPDFILAAAGNVAKVRDMLQSGLVLCNVAISASQLAQYLFPALLVIADIVNASPISTSSTSADATDLLSQSDFDTLAVALKDQRTQDTLHAMITEIQSVAPSVLVSALSAKQQKEILPLLQLAPQIPNALSVLNDFLPVLPSLLGIGRPDHQPVGYLLMTLDHSEIRPVGGFQGQYAVFGVQGGRISHISLNDIYNSLEPRVNPTGKSNNYMDYGAYDYGNPGYLLHQPNNSYNDWFGYESALRNSGLSPDFNMSARYALWYLHNEQIHTPKPGISSPCLCFPSQFEQPYINGGDRLPITDASGKITGWNTKERLPMGGVIIIQTTIIAQLLNVIGPINIGCPYNVRVTADNLESYIHYYQETAAGRAIGSHPCGAQLSDATKRFTAMISQTLQDKVKSVPKGELLKFAGDLLQDLHTKDIQIYLTDPNTGIVDQPTPYAFGNNSLTPYNVYPENTAAMKLLRQYHVVNDFYGTYNEAKGTYYPAYAYVNTKFDDSLTVNRANLAGWKMEQYISLKTVDHITVNKNGSVNHSMQLVYTFNIPQPKVDQNTDLTTALFNVVYNAQNLFNYFEEVRFYVNPNAVPTQLQGLSSPIPSSDVLNRAVFGGQFTYWANEHTDTNTVTWDTQEFTTTNNLTPSISAAWYVPYVVKNGVYTLHMERQSGVNMSYDITVACASSPGTLLQEWQGPLTQDTAFTADNVKC